MDNRPHKSTTSCANLCPICLNKFMPETLEEHHIKPLNYGGAIDGATVELCSNCHLKTHRTAQNLLAKDAPRRYYFAPEELLRAKPYVQIILQSAILAKGKVFPQARNLVIFSLDPRKRILLHMLKKRAGFSSLESYLTALIDREIQKL